ncbi:hypothetical protein [Acetobacter sicerae]|uniref:hypothetical protein n=1 Tax=Acetobacter sicerae TaxID=85325 RepID=UPI00156AC145|nr:hypothetical protein [Acetobacter sicerae]NHN93797.1 hypothetical protein [Acetobacter sicerae]
MVTHLLNKNASLLDENIIIRRRNAMLQMENARFLGVVAAKEREIATLKDELRVRDRKIAALKRDCVGRFV